MDLTFAILRLFGYAVIGFSVGWYVIGPAVYAILEYITEMTR